MFIIVNSSYPGIRNVYPSNGVLLGVRRSVFHIEFPDGEAGSQKKKKNRPSQKRCSRLLYRIVAERVESSSRPVLESTVL